MYVKFGCDCAKIVSGKNRLREKLIVLFLGHIWVTLWSVPVKAFVCFFVNLCLIECVPAALCVCNCVKKRV